MAVWGLAMDAMVKAPATRVAAVPSKGRQRDRAAATRAVLLRAARAAFAAEGYGAAATERIVQQARVTRGALYHHFTGKADLFHAVVSDIAAEIAAQMQARMARAGEPWLALEQGCLGFIDAALKSDARQIYLLDGPAALGWRSWRDIDFAAPGGLLRQAVHACLDASPNAAATLSGNAITNLLSGAMHALVFTVAENPANMSQRAGHERALLELVRTLKFRAIHGGVG